MPLAIDTSDPVNPCYREGVTVCTGDHTNNIFWREGAPGYPGQCILDQMDFEQVFIVLQRVPNAGDHIRRITNNQKLLTLANEVPIAGSEQADDQKAADLINKGRGPISNTIPYYTVMFGNTGGNITGRQR